MLSAHGVSFNSDMLFTETMGKMKKREVDVDMNC